MNKEITSLVAKLEGLDLYDAVELIEKEGYETLSAYQDDYQKRIIIKGYSIVKVNREGYWYATEHRPVNMNDPLNQLLARSGQPVIRF